MCDGAAKGAFRLGAFRVGVDELIVQRRFCEGVYH